MTEEVDRGIFNAPLMEDGPGLNVLNQKIRGVKFEKYRVVKGEFLNRKKIYRDGWNSEELF
jgi:hypothetical protein